MDERRAEAMRWESYHAGFRAHIGAFSLWAARYSDGGWRGLLLGPGLSHWQERREDSGWFASYPDPESAKRAAVGLLRKVLRERIEADTALLSRLADLGVDQQPESATAGDSGPAIGKIWEGGGNGSEAAGAAENAVEAK